MCEYNQKAIDFCYSLLAERDDEIQYEDDNTSGFYGGVNVVLEFLLVNTNKMDIEARACS